MAEVKLVRGLMRGLAVLRALNERDDASAAEISAATGLPRPTVYRLLDTLIADGCVDAAPDGRTYRLTIRCRGFSDGFIDEYWMREVAAPVLASLGRDLVWPADIATREHDVMVIRETTHRSSPLSFHRARAGHRFPLLATSLGFAYLAWCPADERAAIVSILARSDGPYTEMARQPGALERVVEETRARGYGVREGGIVAETGSIAVPVMTSDRCLACINVQFLLSAVSVTDAARRFLAPMRAAAARIEAALAAPE